MIRNDVLLNKLNALLLPEKYKDYCPNGLQLEGRETLTKVICGVSLTEKLIDVCISKGADAIIVHHGLLWNNQDLTITGIKKKRIAKLIKHDINLYAYHLPLDNHDKLGNNIELARVLDIIPEGRSITQDLLWYGKFKQALTLSDLSKLITQKLLHKPQIFANDMGRVITSIAWCSGGGDSFFTQAIALGVDAYLSGEVAEPVFSLAQESNVAYIGAGHYATERYGIKALTKYLNENKIVEAEYIELYNPI